MGGRAAHRRSGGQGRAGHAGARRQGALPGSPRTPGRARSGCRQGRGPRTATPHRGARPAQAGGGGARGRRAGGRAAPGARDRVDGRPGGRQRGAGAVPHSPRRLPGSAARLGGGGEAARIPGAGAAPGGEHDGLEGERCRDHPDGHRDERRAGALPGAARESRVSPRVVVLSSPSGGGKTTIAKRLLADWPAEFGYSVSATTRAPRSGEVEGQAYHFLTRPEFEARVARGEFLEWAEYAGERYGTLKSEVDRVLAAGRHV